MNTEEKIRLQIVALLIELRNEYLRTYKGDYNKMTWAERESRTLYANDKIKEFLKDLLREPGIE